MAKYTLKSGQQKEEEILMINGNQSICPFTNAIPMQGQMGSFQIMRMPCSTLCPHARLTSTNSLHITCGGNTVIYNIEPIEDKPKEETKILTIV